MHQYIQKVEKNRFIHKEKIDCEKYVCLTIKIEKKYIKLKEHLALDKEL